MSRTRRNFSAKFKSELVIELLKGEKDLNTIASENNIQPNLLRNWKKEFLDKAPEYTVAYDGFVNGETEAVLTGTLVVTCDYTEEGREATYAIVPSGLSAKNYAITWKNGVLTRVPVRTASVSPFTKPS